MTYNKSKTLLVFFIIFFVTIAHAQDWANLGRFKEDNEKIKALPADKERVVFMGNSITENWIKTYPDFFTGHYVNRGISGQTTPQMLIRFRADVVDLNPAAVVILAGTNDIAGNTGSSTLAMIMNNIKSMAEIAEANNIKVLLCSVLPAYEFSWSKGKEPAAKIIALNQRIKEYANSKGFVYIDYHSRMVDSRGGLDAKYTNDEVHPTAKGYNVMQPIIEKEIEKALKK